MRGRDQRRCGEGIYPDGLRSSLLGPGGKPTGDRLDKGGHGKQNAARAQEPHGHRPDLTTPDGNLTYRSIIDMTKFTYDDIVKVVVQAPEALRPGKRAWIVGVFDDRPGSYFDKFPPGTVYSIEFEDGSSLEIHESDLGPAS